ncbi:MAG: O-antigen ligase domain-containing protein, partial [Acetobacteraceae bacterium]|nr:O-antigen ligase domain-containing protein [Acetobacteraceae bacterium]
GALQVRLELGVPGAVLAAALALMLGLAVARGAPHPPAAAGALAAAAVSGLLSFGAWQAWWYATLLLVAAGAAGLPRVVRSR